MNESEFEDELRALRPASPSPTLELEIARELTGAPRSVVVRPAAGIIVRPEKRSRFFLGGLAWALGGAAVAALAMLTAPPSWLGRGVSPGKSGAPVETMELAYFEPLESAREVVATETSEIFYDDDAGASQVVRTSSVERHSWTNPTTGAVVEVEVPREDFVLVPVAYQ
ncbi:MAG TPA: hypothetical protein VGO11_04380 [Chthoniobacteraceae bacterium]|jgi:hypothetical protein|nr:hypothetical protein [Chthoniobacteraceae bacterium]